MTMISNIPGNNTPEGSISSLLQELGSQDGSKHQQARLALVGMGKAAVPALIEALDSPNRHLRWEAGKALTEIADPAAAEALVNSLEDEDIGVRWVAAEALTKLGRVCLIPLMNALKACPGSVLVREGAHHILRVLKSKNKLAPAEIQVYDVLEDVASDIKVPFAAEEALKKLTASRPNKVTYQ